MISKNKLTKLVTIAALTIPLSTALAATNKTLAMQTTQENQQASPKEENQTDIPEDALQQLLDITNMQTIIVDRILSYLGIELGNEPQTTEIPQV